MFAFAHCLVHIPSPSLPLVYGRYRNRNVYILPYRVVSCRVVSYHIASYCIASYPIIPQRIRSYHIVLYCVVSYRTYLIIWYCIISYRTIVPSYLISFCLKNEFKVVRMNSHFFAFNDILFWGFMSLTDWLLTFALSRNFEGNNTKIQNHFMRFPLIHY